MARIFDLTRKQIAGMAVSRDEWLQAGLAVRKADRPRAEAGVRQAYRAAGLAPPKFTIWLQSPMAGAIGSALLAGAEPEGRFHWVELCDEFGNRYFRRVWDDVWAQLGRQLEREFGLESQDGVCEATWYEEVNPAGLALRERIWDGPISRAFKDIAPWVAEDICDDVWFEVGRPVGERVWDEVGAQARAAAWVDVVNRVTAGGERYPWNDPRQKIRRKVDRVLWDQVWIEVWSELRRALYGQHDVATLAYLSFFSDNCDPAIGAELCGLNEIGRSCGWWWPFENVAVLTERPVEVHLDDEGRLHNQDAAALVYPDGWEIWAVHGGRLQNMASAGRA
jgi:hypothetical protein